MDNNTGDGYLSSGWIQKIDFFKNQPTQLLSQLLSEHQIISTANKQNIFEQGESANHFGFVIQGIYSLSKMDSTEQRVVLDFVHAGGMIAGLLMAMPSATYPITVQSVGQAQLLVISKQVYRQYWALNPEVMQKVQMANLERVRALHAMRETQRFSSEKKVAWVLLKLLAHLGLQDKPLRLTVLRRDIADAAGVATESVIRILSLWGQLGLLQVQGSDEFIDLTQLEKKYF